MEPVFSPLELKVQRIIRETRDVKTFRLSGEGPIPFDFFPGQFLILSFRLYDPSKGREVNKNRAFSVSSSPTDRDYLEVTVKKTGRVTRHMHETLGEGDTVRVKNRAGEFYYREGMGERLVLIAGGTGVAPLMSMIRYIGARRLPVGLILLYSNRTPEEFAFSRELEEQERQIPGFRCLHTVTRPEGHAWNGRIGRIGQPMLEEAGVHEYEVH